MAMNILELVGVAISYGLLKSIALKDGNIDFRAMFREKMKIINDSFTKPFKDGVAAIKKRAASLDLVDDDDAEVEVGNEQDPEGAQGVENGENEEEHRGSYLENHVESLTATEEKMEEQEASFTLPTSSRIYIVIWNVKVKVLLTIFKCFIRNKAWRTYFLLFLSPESI